MTKEQYLDWKGSLATQEILAQLKDRVSQLEYEIARSAGDDSKYDLIRRGYILGIEDLVNIQFEEELHIGD